MFLTIVTMMRGSIRTMIMMIRSKNKHTGIVELQCS